MIEMNQPYKEPTQEQSLQEFAEIKMLCNAIDEASANVFAVVDAFVEQCEADDVTVEYLSDGYNLQEQRIINIIKKWQKGCSCADESPDECQECTRSMIRALNRAVRGSCGGSIVK